MAIEQPDRAWCVGVPRLMLELNMANGALWDTDCRMRGEAMEGD